MDGVPGGRFVCWGGLSEERGEEIGVVDLAILGGMFTADKTQDGPHYTIQMPHNSIPLMRHVCFRPLVHQRYCIHSRDVRALMQCRCTYGQLAADCPIDSQRPRLTRAPAHPLCQCHLLSQRRGPMYGCKIINHDSAVAVQCSEQSDPPSSDIRERCLEGKEHMTTATRRPLPIITSFSSWC